MPVVGRRATFLERSEELVHVLNSIFLNSVWQGQSPPDYRHRRHREVQTLFSWCVRMGQVDQNVFKRVPRSWLSSRTRTSSGVKGGFIFSPTFTRGTRLKTF